MSNWDETADFVIIGSGGGSMCAALACLDHGLRPLILEKEPLVGGSTAMSGGILWIPGNALMAEAGVPDSPELGLEYLQGLVPEQPGSTLCEHRPQDDRLAARQGHTLRLLPGLARLL
jgi:3-oxosteroid 1-dehydrogenase